MPIGFYIGEVNSLDTCCGVRELGSLCVIKRKTFKQIESELNESGRRSVRHLIVKDGEDVAKAVTEWIQRIMYNYRAAFYQIWFAANGNYDDDSYDLSSNANSYDEYDCNELRKIVQQFPNVVKLGEAHNPNSGNKIDGYLWERF